MGNKKTAEIQANRIVPAIVCFAAITISTWSIMWVIMNYGHKVPWFIAILGSAAFDGLAIYASLQSARNTRTKGYAGIFPRTTTVVFGSFSAWINYEHGHLIQAPIVISCILAGVSISAIVAVELILGSLKKTNGQITIPPMITAARFYQPIRSAKMRRTMYVHYLDRLEEKGKDTLLEIEEEDTSPAITRNDSALVRAWANDNGIKVSSTGRISQAVYEEYDLYRMANSD